MRIQWLFDIIEAREQNPSDTSLCAEGLPKIAQKVDEEGTETFRVNPTHLGPAVEMFMAAFAATPDNDEVEVGRFLNAHY